MIKDFINLWEENKKVLKNELKNEVKSNKNNISYKLLLEKIIRLILNKKYCFCEQDIHVIDDGDYQGTLVMLFYDGVYQPGASDYVITYVSYGSCSGCDTLLAALECNVDENQIVEDLMLICLHLIENMKWLKEALWQQTKDI